MEQGLQTLGLCQYGLIEVDALEERILAVRPTLGANDQFARSRSPLHVAAIKDNRCQREVVGRCGVLNFEGIQNSGSVVLVLGELLGECAAEGQQHALSPR